MLLPLLVTLSLAASVIDAQVNPLLSYSGLIDTCNGVDDLDYAYSDPKASESWLLATGNRSVISTIWSIAAKGRFRIVSDGDFYDSTVQRQRNYAIMHEYDGAVYLRPEQMNFTELTRQARENQLRSLALTRVCGRVNVTNGGQVMFATFWVRIEDVNYQLWFPGSPSADTLKLQYDQQGLRPVELCGYNVQGRAQYIGVVLQEPKSTAPLVPYDSFYGLLSDGLAKDNLMKQKNYIAIKFQVFNVGSQVYCTFIWEQRPGCTYRIEMDKSVSAMHRRILPDITMKPRQISHFIDPIDNCLKYAVLWSNVDSFRYPVTENPQWPKNLEIPKSYLPGSTTNLDPTTIGFIEQRINLFMRTQNVFSVSVAVSLDERLKFAASFGLAFVRSDGPINPSHQFRISAASVPVTAAAILKLVEQAQLRLDSKVFGPGSLFGTKYMPPISTTSNYLCEITVRHLLEHTTGNWTANLPVYTQPQMNNAQFISYVVSQFPVQQLPGTQWEYSNFGYLLLGEIIATVSGMSYEDYVKQNIWIPAGVTGAFVAGRFISQKGPNEVMYYMSGQNGTKEGADPYLEIPVERLAPFAGWVVSPSDLLKFVAKVDGFGNKPDILSNSSIMTWSTPSLASNDTYGQGWFLNVNGWNGWVSYGRMPGSTSLLVRLDNGLSFAFLTNKDYSGLEFFHQIDYLMQHIIGLRKSWENNSVDLFCAQGSNCP